MSAVHTTSPAFAAWSRRPRVGEVDIALDEARVARVLVDTDGSAAIVAAWEADEHGNRTAIALDGESASYAMDRAQEQARDGREADREEAEHDRRARRCPNEPVHVDGCTCRRGLTTSGYLLALVVTCAISYLLALGVVGVLL